MPRDLSALANESTLQHMPPITLSPAQMTQTESDDIGSRLYPVLDNKSPATGLEAELALKENQSHSKRDKLHPYTQTLSASDIPSCQRIEDAAFPPQERCTDAKFRYRFSKCPELTLGIFTSHADNNIPTASTSAPVHTGTPERKAVLLGHIIATRTTNQTVTDDDMAIPSPDHPTPDDDRLGHKESGRTICIHSLAVLPDFHGHGLGSTLLLAYIQRMELQGLADRLALIAHDHLIPFYEKLGFVNRGESKAQFGGGGWYDMVRELQAPGVAGQ